jgi:hypothetical protein
MNNIKRFLFHFWMPTIFLLVVFSCKKDDPAPTFSLTVVNGTGSGQYQENTQVSISANTPPQGQEFDAWTGDASLLADASSANTTLTMPARNVSVTATFNVISFTLTVNGGSGSGSYEPGATVNIAATVPTGQVFDKWTGDVNGIADVNAATTTLTMPSANASVTATFKNLFSLTVNGGTGSGNYAGGEVVNIEATVPAEQMFDQWTGDVSGVADVNASATTVTMPESAVSLTATFKSPFTLTVNGGTGGGSYFEGEEVTIRANDPAVGKVFAAWTGDVTGLNDVNAVETIITMPAANVNLTSTYNDLPKTFAIEGTWKLSGLFESLGGADFNKISTSENFRVTFNVNQDYNPTTYVIVPGNSLAIPNYKGNTNEGDWSVDSIDDPKSIVFDPEAGEGATNVNVQYSGDATTLVIWWVETSSIPGKPARTYKMEMVPAE